MKLQKEETTRLESIVTSLTEKLTIQQQRNLTNEQHLPPFASVFQRAEACVTFKRNSKEEKTCNPLIEKIKIPPISILQYYFNVNFNEVNASGTIVELKHSLVISELCDKQNGVITLSVNNNKILVGSYADRNEDAYIYCCNTNGDKLSTFKVRQFLKSAVWINNSQFIYTCFIPNERAKIVSKTGDITSVQLVLRSPERIYVSFNNPEFIYIADYYNGLYRSADGGITWSLVFNLPEKVYSKQAIRLIKDDYDGIQIY